MNNIVSLIFAFFSFAVILVLAYFTSKFVAINSNKINNGKNMEIIDVLNLGNNKKILMIKILEKVYILGVSNNGDFNTIDTIEDDAIVNNLEKTNNNIGFDELLKSKLKFKNIENNVDDKSFKSNNLSKLVDLRDKLANLKPDAKANFKKDE